MRMPRIKKFQSINKIRIISGIRILSTSFGDGNKAIGIINQERTY